MEYSKVLMLVKHGIRFIKISMNPSATLQEQMDAAFDNYFELSEILQADMTVLLDGENESQHWRRNFIRSSAALVEGYAHCLRDMCAVCFECISPEITKKEAEVIRNEKKFDVNDRIKLTLRVAYKLFELSPAPDFGGNEWPKAQKVLAKRHLLMHPKTPSDLVVTDASWEEIRKDTIWIIEQLFNFFSLLNEKYRS